MELPQEFQAAQTPYANSVLRLSKGSAPVTSSFDLETTQSTLKTADLPPPQQCLTIVRQCGTKSDDSCVTKAKSDATGHTVASLFSGCGGFDIGFQQRGFRLIGAFDNDPHVVATYNDNVAPIASVCDLSTKTPVIRPDVLLAGSPCQGFSTAGKRDLADPRNDLLVRAGIIALDVRPRVFVMENVPAAISGRHGTRWQQVEQMLKDGGYSVARFLADGPSSGVPQFRKRLFLIAWSGRNAIRCQPDPVPAPPLSAALENLDGLSGHDPIPLPAGSREQLIARRISPGKKLCNVRLSPAAVPTWDIPEVFGPVTASEREVLVTLVRLRRRNRRRTFGDADPVLPSVLNHHLERRCDTDISRLIAARYLRRVESYIDLTHTYNGKFRRLPTEGVSPTVDTHFGDPRLFIHPHFDRGLTPREAARIQGFPDHFVIAGNRLRAFKMIGNAVPPPMAARLADFTRDVLLAPN